MTPSRRRWWWSLLASSVCVSAAISTFGDCALTKSAPNSTLGTKSSVVTPNVVIHGLPSDQIDGRPIPSPTLEQSFQKYNLDTGRGAFFTNPVGIKNIVGLVPALFSGASSKSPKKYILYFDSLKCNKPAAGAPNADQVSLYVENKKVWEFYPMTAGYYKAPIPAPGTVMNNSTVIVRLYAQNRSILVGSVSVSNKPVQERPVQLGKGNADYTLTYTVTRTPRSPSIF